MYYLRLENLVEQSAAAAAVVVRPSLQLHSRLHPSMPDYPPGISAMRVPAALGTADRSRGLEGQSLHSCVDELPRSVRCLPRAAPRLQWTEVRLPCVPELQAVVA